MEPQNLNAWLEGLKSPEAEARDKAVRSAGPMGAQAVAALADLMASSDKAAARSAKQALQHVAHHSARPGARPNEARLVTQEMLKVAASARPRMVRSEALELTGFIGDREAVPGLLALLRDAEVREEARLALERIPGPEAERALQAALQSATEDFASALRQSLRARSLTPATVGA